MPESREHRLLVAATIKRLQSAGVDVHAAAASGWPTPPLVGGRRPDVFGYLAGRAAAVAGEAKRGPELVACRDQLSDIACGLRAHSPFGCAGLLVITVGAGWEDEAAEWIRSVITPMAASVTVWS